MCLMRRNDPNQTVSELLVVAGPDADGWRGYAGGDCDAERVIVLKRSMNPGFAGVENGLFHNAKTSMLFGDAKNSPGKLTSEIRAF